MKKLMNSLLLGYNGDVEIVLLKGKGKDYI